MPECELYGRCHCGCDAPTLTARTSNATRDEVRGFHHIWKHGHNPHGRGPGCLGRVGLEPDSTAWRLRRLVEHYGSIRKTADALGIPASSLKGYLHGDRKRIPAKRANQIARFARKYAPGRAAWLVSTEPLQDPLAAARCSEWQDGYHIRGGWNDLCERYAARFGLTDRQARRDAMVVRKPLAPVAVVDRWATLLGVWIDLEPADVAS